MRAVEDMGDKIEYVDVFGFPLRLRPLIFSPKFVFIANGKYYWYELNPHA
jgi:hypothetical protein